MIKNISKIVNCGIYRNFSWSPANTSDFTEKNIIFGWNYSGKTTLSRLLNVLGSGKRPDTWNNGEEFEVYIEQEGAHPSKVIVGQDFPFSVHVFNSDYINDNLRLHIPGQKIEGILFDIGVASSEQRTKLIQLRQDIQTLKAQVAKRDAIDRFEQLEGVFTKTAKRIKNDDFQSSIEFTKAHLKRIAELIPQNQLNSNIIQNPDLLAQTRANALAKAPLSSIAPLNFRNSWDAIKTQVELFCSHVPKAVEEDQILSSDPYLYNWGKNGITWYIQHPNETTCAFCGGVIDKSRMDFLNAFYTNEAARLKGDGEKLKQDIEIEKQSVSSLVEYPISLNDISEGLRNELSIKATLLKENAGLYICVLDTILKTINQKLSRSLFENLPLPDINDACVTDMQSSISAINALIDNHNNIVHNFTEVKTSAIESLKKHLVSECLKVNKYYELKRQKEQQETAVSIASQRLSDKIREEKEVEASLKSITKGQERLNEFLNLMFCRNDLQVETTEDNFFTLRRNHELAHNLSEGEKTAIAFAYFVISYESLSDELKEKAIIVIDDPISSLDANHMAQVASIINSSFFKKLADNSIGNLFHQLFILTHNFEFLGFLRDATNIKRKKKSDPKGRLQLYLLKRTANSDVNLTLLPKSLNAFKSEYIYLFSQLYEYKESGHNEDFSYLMPNVIRRFLEIYTLSKLPGNTDEIDNRIKLLVSDINELKILHHFSHCASLDRLTRHDEMVMRIPDIVDDIFTVLSKDPVHYSSLCEGINKPVI